MNIECVEKARPNPTIGTIDEQVALLHSRLINILDHVRSGCIGESPTEKCCATECPIPSSSLDSIDQRLGEIYGTVSTIENFVKRFHS